MILRMKELLLLVLLGPWNQNRLPKRMLNLRDNHNSHLIKPLSHIRNLQQGSHSLLDPLIIETELLSIMINLDNLFIQENMTAH